MVEVHSRQFCYVASWFLEAHCARRKAAEYKAVARGVPVEHDAEGFALVASVLNQETFVLMNRFMQRSIDDKAWQDLNAAMKFFTQIVRFHAPLALGQADRAAAPHSPGNV